MHHEKERDDATNDDVAYVELTDRTEGEESKRTSTWNRNVLVILLYTFVVQMARSIWQAQILSIYLLDLSGSTSVVGFIEGAQGVCRLLTALLTGYAVDKFLRRRKNLVLRLTCLYGIGVFGVATYCVLYVRRAWVWYVILAAYSPQRSMQMSVVGTIFADSMQTGNREQVYTIYRMISNLGSVVGPVVQIVYFYYFSSDDWSSKNLRTVMLIGIALSCSALPVQLFIDERSTMDDRSEARQRQRKRGRRRSPSPSPPLMEDKETRLGVRTEDAAVSARAGDDEEREDNRERNSERYARMLRRSVIAYDVLRVLFGGLVDKYFGIFFKDQLGISPIDSALIQLGCRVCIIVTTGAVGWLSKYISAAFVCLGLLVFVNLSNVTLAVDPDEPSSGYMRWVLVAAYVVRGSALVSVFGLKHALLMDNVPKKDRGKYSAIDDLQSGFWSGSAALGGVLIKHYSYRLAFAIMSGGFGLASCAWLGVVWSDTRTRDDEFTDEKACERRAIDPSKGVSDEGASDVDRSDGDWFGESAGQKVSDTDDDDTYDIGERYSRTMCADTFVCDDGFIPIRSSFRQRVSTRKRRREKSPTRFRSPSLPAMRKIAFDIPDDFDLENTWPPRPGPRGDGE